MKKFMEIFGGSKEGRESVDMRELQQLFDLVKKIVSGREHADDESRLMDKKAIAVGFLISTLYHNDPLIRIEVIRLLKKLKDDRAVDDLVRIIGDSKEDIRVQSSALDCLVQMKTKRSIDALCALMIDQRNMWRVAEAMVLIGKAAAPELIDLLQNAKADPSVRSIAIAILQKISGHDYDADVGKWRVWLSSD